MTAEYEGDVMMEFFTDIFVVSIEAALIVLLWCIVFCVVDHILDGVLSRSLNNFIRDRLNLDDKKRN